MQPDGVHRGPSMTSTPPAIDRTADAPRIALIHATRLSIEAIEQAFRAHWPEASCFHLLETSLTADRVRTPPGAASLEQRFIALSRYAQIAGAAGILYTCSAFGPEIEAARRAVRLPTLKPNEAMLAEALARGRRVGLLATFAPTLTSMRDELEAMAAERGVAVEIETAFVPGAMDALDRGDATEHDRMIASAARAMESTEVLLLAQFSMARARPAVAAVVEVPVLTSPETAVVAMRRAVGAAVDPA
jgi:Asp/Glu/hydantoin racemase